MIDSFKQVGNTPLIKLNLLEPDEGASIWLKLEGGNPTGSYKDRMAISIIGNAIKRGDLKKGQTVIEYTGGSTGSSLAFACAASGVKFTAIFSDAFSDSKRLTMERFGAKVIIVPSFGKGITPELIQKMKDLAHQKVNKFDAFDADQFGSEDVVLGYQTMGTEIAVQLQGKLTILCAAVGTGGALMGTLRGLNNEKIFPKTVAIEPAQSPLLTKGKGGPHKIEGVGVGFYPPFLTPDSVNDVLAIDQEKAFKMSTLLAERHGIFCGTSTGLNVVGAMELARSLPPNENIVTFGCDTGLKYL